MMGLDMFALGIIVLVSLTELLVIWAAWRRS
jgi:membrane-associated protease RseP (regulator of RpoE activity)